MKLRNKKTGEYGRFMMCHDDDRYPFYIEATGESRLYYHNFEEMLRAGWEVYVAPTDPLIRDEKIRKAVRAWAEVEGETQVQVTHCRKHILSIWSVTKENGNIDFDCDIEDTFDEGFYTINQLCGTPEPLEPTFVDLDERIKEKEKE